MKNMNNMELKIPMVQDDIIFFGIPYVIVNVEDEIVSFWDNKDVKIGSLSMADIKDIVRLYSNLVNE